jgi:CRP-like cAMP-binding protein
MTVYEIGRVSFLSAVTGQPADAVEDTRHRARQTEPDPLTRPLAHVLANIAFLSELVPPDLERLAETAIFETWQAGDAIVREGETATAFFVLLSGRARTTINGRPVSELLAGDSFGEIALLHGVQRTATVAAIEPARTCRISADSLQANAAQLIGKSEAAGRPALDLSG